MPEATSQKLHRVVLVEDHLMFREWLGEMLTRGQCEICGESDNIRDALTVILDTRPDIVIVDISLKGSSGLELIKDLRAQKVDVPVLVLSMHDEVLYAERALRAGARGYISKNEATATLSHAIQHVLSGHVYLGEKMTSAVLDRMAGREPRSSTTGLEVLADRELEVFRLIGRGCTTREIAAQLRLGETTVETYRARIKDKLHLRNTAALATRAAQWVQETGG
ncbi:MAG TPA: response regulator transcription factor [Chthoniobacteraceae bacterium]|jgi:DNA-binding NarL/FixJ family response regulator|nr:response regulator transcription factor [Chthoniobacteraceae bacterium]